MDTLKTKKEFDFVYKNGFQRYSKNFALYIYKDTRNAKSDSLLGISVSKKVGNAVKRNLIKRRIRALCRETKKISNGFRIVFVAKVGILDLSFNELKYNFLQCLECALNKLHIKQKFVRNPRIKPNI